MSAAGRRVVLATRNAGKLTELRRILAQEASECEVLGLDDLAPYDEPAETEPTFEGNALTKARAALTALGHQLEVEGPRTNVPQLRALLADPSFAAA